MFFDPNAWLIPLLNAAASIPALGPSVAVVFNSLALVATATTTVATVLKPIDAILQSASAKHPANTKLTQVAKTSASLLYIIGYFSMYNATKPGQIVVTAPVKEEAVG